MPTIKCFGISFASRSKSMMLRLDKISYLSDDRYTNNKNIRLVLLVLWPQTITGDWWHAGALIPLTITYVCYVYQVPFYVVLTLNLQATNSHSLTSQSTQAQSLTNCCPRTVCVFFPPSFFYWVELFVQQNLSSQSMVTAEQVPRTTYWWCRPAANFHVPSFNYIFSRWLRASGDRCTPWNTFFQYFYLDSDPLATTYCVFLSNLII